MSLLISIIEVVVDTLTTWVEKYVYVTGNLRNSGSSSQPKDDSLQSRSWPRQPSQARQVRDHPYF